VRNLIGNPYASSLDADSFLLDSSNSSASCIFLWTRNTLASSLVSGADAYNFSTLDYAMYNVLGGINAGENITLNSRNTPNPIGTTLVPISDRKNLDIPDGKIYFGTSFYLRTTSAGTVTFKNTMTTTPTGQIFRHSTNTSLITPPTRSRIWINLSEGNTYDPINGKFRQALIGYATGATTAGTDRLFDAAPLNHATFVPLIDVYSFAPSSTTNLSIQGRDNFQNTDVFQLGYKVKDAGNYTFSTTHDGIFTTKPYYILDNTDGVYHTLPYTFYTSSGTFNNRFKVVFENLVSITSPPNICGSQLVDINNTVYSTNIAGITTYKYQVKIGSDSGPVLGVFDGQNPTYPYVFNLNFPGVTFDTWYSISVAIYQVNGSWVYGPSCLIKTPSNPPTSNLTSSSCNTLLASYWQTLYAQQIAAVGISAIQYRFNATVGGVTYVFTAPATSPVTSTCNLHSFVAAGMPLTPNTVYSITVDVLWNGSWQNGTVVCTVTSPNSLPRFSNNNLSIFEVKAYPNPFANNFKLDINTSSEETIEVTVYDMLGRQIESRQIKNADLGSQEIGEHYTSGVYNVIVKQNDNSKTLRMIKR